MFERRTLRSRAGGGRRLVLAVGCLLAAAQASGAEPRPPPTSPVVRSGCEDDYPPFSIVHDDGQPDGFSVALLREALRATGREVTFEVASWPAIKRDLAEGRLQALPMVARTAEREATFDFTVPYLTMHGTIVVRDDTADIRGPEDLRGKRVAVLEEDFAQEYLRRANLGAVVVPLPSFAAALRELSAGKHDAVVIQKLLAFQIMKEAGLKNLRTVGPPLAGYQQDFCFAVRKGDRALLEVLNEGLSLVVANGTFRRLHAEWFAPLEALGRPKSRIVVGGDANYPPYEFLDANGQPAGYNVDLTRAIARRMGLAVDIRLGPWAAVREGLDRGSIDVVHGMFYSAERDATFDFSPPHAIVDHAIVVRTGTPAPPDLQALAGQSVLVMRGDILDDLAVRQGLGERLVRVETQEEALRLLASGQHDAALVARLPALSWIERHGWRNLEVGQQPVASAEYCYAVPDRNQALISTFSEGLAALKATGEYRAIQTRWLGAYEQARPDPWAMARYVLLGALPVAALLMGALLWTRSLRRLVHRRTGDLQREKEALGVSEEKFSKAFHGSTSAMAITRLRDGLFLEVNDRYLEIMHLAREDVIGRTGAQLRLWKHPEDRAAFARNLSEHGLVRNAEYHFVRRGGEEWTGLVSSHVSELEGEPVVISSISDITARKRAEEALRESEQRFRLALRNAPVSVAVQDRELRYTWTYNQRTGTPDQIVGHTDHDLFSPEHVAHLTRIKRRVLDEGVELREQLWLERPGGRVFLDICWEPIRDEAGQVTGVASASVDLTPLKLAERELREANLLLAEADRSKNQFLATLSHELRNPLAPIVNCLYILDHAPPGGDQAGRARRIIGRQVAQLSSLVNDLLDVTRITSNKIQLQREPLELNEVVRRAVEDNRSLFDRAGVRLALAPAPEPVPVRADRTRVSQIVGNLLQNSAKFTLRGGLTTVAVAREGDQATIRVTDDGVGMDGETLRRLFQPFMQADQSLDRSKGGLGLGLALIKGLVELHGGSIAAHSDGLGKGAELLVRLPLEAAPAAAAAATRPGGAPVRRRILIIEDNVDAAASLREALELGDHEAVVAHDGPAGLAKAREYRPDVVLCDIGLPGMDGYQVARAFRADEQLRGAALVALSGYALPEDLQHAAEAGFERHLAKPPSLEKLEELLSGLPEGRAQPA